MGREEVFTGWVLVSKVLTDGFSAVTFTSPRLGSSVCEILGKGAIPWRAELVEKSVGEKVEEGVGTEVGES